MDETEKIIDWLLKKLGERDEDFVVESRSRIDGESTVGLEINGQTYFISVERA